jgi:hypothetical protein
LRVQWVHPSWRDVVIDALAADADARRHFLQRCGVDGVALALSWGGGAEGERERPLLRADADWDALGDGLYALCHDADEVEAVRLLGVLENAGRFDEVLALDRLVLERLGWSGKAVSVDAICAWMPVAALLDPRPEPPAITMTWLELEPAGLPVAPEEIERFYDWLRLAELLHDHDKELLARLGFPDRHEALLRDFAEGTPRDEPPGERDLRIESLARIAAIDPVLTHQCATEADALRFESMPVIAAIDDRVGFPVERVLRDL